MAKELIGGRQRPPLKIGLEVLSIIVVVLVLLVGLMWALIARVFG
jgi:hypothetical protein